MRNRLMPEQLQKIDDLRTAAARAGLFLPTVEAAYGISRIIEEKITDLLSALELSTAEELLALVSFSRTLDMPLENLDRLRDRFWRVLHLPPRPVAAKEKLRAVLQQLGDNFAFVWETTAGLLGRLLP